MSDKHLYRILYRKGRVICNELPNFIIGYMCIADSKEKACAKVPDECRNDISIEDIGEIKLHVNWFDFLLLEYIWNASPGNNLILDEEIFDVCGRNPELDSQKGV